MSFRISQIVGYAILQELGHGSLRITPARAAEITDHVWNFSELIGG